MKTIWFTLLAVFCTVAVGVYYIVQPTFGHNDPPKLLRVGVLPTEHAESLRMRYYPLLDYLSAKTGLEFKMIVVSDYSELARLFRDHGVDLAYVGGLTLVNAYLSHHAVPLVMRDIDTRFTSWFLVRKDDPARYMSDLQDRVLSFGSLLSTSGHLIPRYFLKVEKRIIPETFFAEVRYSSGHARTAYLVRDGAVDVGVVNPESVGIMLEDGRLKNDDLRVLWETPPYPNYVWAVHSRLGEEVRAQLLDAFLDLDVDDPVYGDILLNMGAEAFYPVGIGDFPSLKGIAETLGLLEADIK